MDKLLEFISKSCYLTQEEISSVQLRLYELGFSSIGDLEFLQPESDLKGVISVLKCRQLKKSIECTSTINEDEGELLLFKLIHIFVANKCLT